MCSRVLFAGREPLPGLAEAARQLNCAVFGLFRQAPEAQGFDQVVTVAEVTAPAMEQEARRVRAGLVVPTDEGVLQWAADVCCSAGASGPAVRAARAVRNKAFLRNQLHEAGLGPADWVDTGTNLARGERAALGVGLPVLVRPVDGSSGRGVMRVGHEADIVLALRRALVASPSRRVLVEPCREGKEYHVFLYMRDGRPEWSLVTGLALTPATRVPPRETAASSTAGRGQIEGNPHALAREVFVPCPAPRHGNGSAVELAARIAALFDIRSGLFRAEFLADSAGPCDTIEIGLAPASSHPVETLLRDAWGIDLNAEAVRAHLGLRTTCPHDLSGAAALAWIAYDSGVVRRVEGVGKARAVPGVVSVRVAARVGDMLGHAVDNASRARAGCVVAVARDVESARNRAREAVDHVRVVTEKVLST